MEIERLYNMVGQLYARCSALEEDNKKLRLNLQAKDDELGLLRDRLRGLDNQRTSDK